MASFKMATYLPVEATAKWSGKSERYKGIRYLDEQGNEVEFWNV
jgi:hypothetical protein